MIIQILRFFIYSSLIVIIAKYVLVPSLRKLGENLNLRAHTIGNIAGVATSIPEFLTVSISSVRGLVGTSIFNILSSNIINLLQYIVSIVLTKNYKILKNKGILYNIILVIITILIPSLFIFLKIELNLYIVPVFLFLYFAFIYISKKNHKKFLKVQDEKIEKQEGIEEEKERKTNKKTYVYIIYLLLASIILYIIGSKLGKVLEKLATIFKISEGILGFFLGFITSIPELITFFESQKHYKDKGEDKILGVIEATNNLLTSNMLNLFIIQNIGIVIFFIINYSFY